MGSGQGSSRASSAAGLGLQETAVICWFIRNMELQSEPQPLSHRWQCYPHCPDEEVEAQSKQRTGANSGVSFRALLPTSFPPSIFCCEPHGKSTTQSTLYLKKKIVNKIHGKFSSCNRVCRRKKIPCLLLSMYYILF